jgi:hypothetical protein
MNIDKTVLDKTQLVKVLDNLPESAVKEIIDFAEFISARQSGKRSMAKKKPSVKDPILKLIGIADVKPFADNIEHELYGQC